MERPSAMLASPSFSAIESTDKDAGIPDWRQSEEYESIISKNFMRPRERRCRSSQELTPERLDSKEIDCDSGSSEGELGANIANIQKRGVKIRNQSVSSGEGRPNQTVIGRPISENLEFAKVAADLNSLVSEYDYG